MTEEIKTIVESIADKTQEITSLPQVRGENYLSIYSNSVNLILSPWDIRMIFGELRDNGNQQMVIENRASIVMSPQHAKAFLVVLTNHMKSYEAQHGTISVKLKIDEDNPDAIETA